MLSFELKKATTGSQPEMLQIHCDHAGLDALLAQLRLLEQACTDHVHLMAVSWGGSHLDEAPQEPDSVALRHVKILLHRE